MRQALHLNFLDVVVLVFACNAPVNYNFLENIVPPMLVG